MDFLQVLGILDSKQVDILVYILENTEPANNTFVGTYARIQKETGISQMTISRVLKKLQDANFLKKNTKRSLASVRANYDERQ